jgi:hypothetical protein
MGKSSAISGLRAALERIKEALEDGDASFAYSIAESALEPPVVRLHVCPDCALSFQWIGELDHHRRFAHEIEAAA